MKKIKYLIFLLIVGGVAYFYQPQILDFYSRFVTQNFPCSQPITYSLGTFDTKFGISKTDFLSALTEAEQIWEKPIGKQLFSYADNGTLKINLIYDYRQEATNNLSKMGIKLDNSQTSYDSLKAKMQALEASYNIDKAQFDAQVAAFDAKKNAYEAEVRMWNSGNKKITQDVVDRLTQTKTALDGEVLQLKQYQDSINKQVDDINAMVVALNQLASTLNLNVAKYNTVGKQLGGEFDEGTYHTGPDGQWIDVYQFDNRSKLVRVLAHELGHALGLEHNDNPKAIMYRLNNGINEKLVADDLAELKTLCKIK